MAKLIVFIFLFLLTFSSRAGEIYITEGDRGEVKYTNIKPGNNSEKVLETKVYNHPEAPAPPEPETETGTKKVDKEHQDYVNEIFRERAELLYEKEQRLIKEIEDKEEYIYDLEEVIEDYLVNGYFADNYIFELKVQKSNLEKLNKELHGIDEQWYQLKKEARKNNVRPGILRVR